MNHIKRILYYLGLTIGFLLFGNQLVRGFQSIIQKRVDFTEPLALFLVFIVLPTSFGLQVLNWSLIISNLGVRIKFRDITKGYYLSFITRYIPGTIWGYISRSEWLFREYGINYKLSGAASLIEFLFSITSAFIVLGITSLLSAKVDKGLWIPFALAFPLLVWYINKRLSGIKTIIFLGKEYPNLFYNLSFKLWVKSHCINLVFWATYGLATLLTIYAIKGMDFSALFSFSNFINGTFVFTFAWTIGFIIPFLPGGLGVRELVLATFISMYFHLDIADATLISVGLRIAVSIVEICWILWGISFSTRRSARDLEK